MFTILSGILGGVLRLVPELFKFLDAKNERKHELDMQDKALEFQRVKGDQRIDEIQSQSVADSQKSILDAYITALKEQTQPSGIKWVDAFSKLMRPSITLEWVVLLYPAAIVSTFIIMISRGTDAIVAINACFGEHEKALCAFLIDFWFVGRTLEKK